SVANVPLHHISLSFFFHGEDGIRDFHVTGVQTCALRSRGQGRSHAVRLAEEGADIIAVDICADIETIGYSMAKPEDLEETAKLVEKTGRGVYTAQADVRNADQLRTALEGGLKEFGKVDIVVAQAG